MELKKNIKSPKKRSSKTDNESKKEAEQEIRTRIQMRENETEALKNLLSSLNNTIADQKKKK